MFLCHVPLVYVGMCPKNCHRLCIANLRLAIKLSKTMYDQSKIGYKIATGYVQPHRVAVRL